MRKRREYEFIEDGAVIDYIRRPRPEDIEQARRIIERAWEVYDTGAPEVCQHQIPHAFLLHVGAELLRTVDNLQAWLDAANERHERTMERHLRLADDLHEVRQERNRLYAQLMAEREQKKRA